MRDVVDHMHVKVVRGRLEHLRKRLKTYRKFTIYNPIINFKVTFFEPAIGSRPTFARMCG